MWGEVSSCNPPNLRVKYTFALPPVEGQGINNNNNYSYNYNNNNNNLYLYSVVSTKKPITLYSNNTCKIYDENT